MNKSSFISLNAIVNSIVSFLFGLDYINSKGEVTGNNYSYHQLINQPKLTADKNIIISAKGARPVNQASIVFIDNNAVVLNSADIKSYNGDVRIDAALGDINLEASQAAFMDGSQTTTTKRKWYGKKKTKIATKTSFNTNAITTDIAAKNIKLTAESDINIYGSELKADPKGTIGITAGRLLNLYKIEDRSESATDIKTKSSFLGIRYNKNHTNDTRQELSQLPAILAANSAALKSGGNTLIQGSIFNTENANTIQVGYGKYADANAKVILEAITNQITTTHNQEKESTLWQKTVQERDTVTTAQLPKFNQTPTITLPDGGSIVVEIPVEITVDRNKKAKEAIKASPEKLGRIALELSKQPGYEYLAELDKNNDIDWQQVNLIQEHFAFEQEGLTPGAAALIAIAVTIALSGMDGGGIGTTLMGQSFATPGVVGSVSTVTTTGIAANAAFASLASQAAINLISNQGDISKTLKQLASSSMVRSMATAALTAGVGAKLGLVTSPDYGFSQNLANSIGKGVTQAVADAAFNGMSFEEALKNSLRSSLVDVFAAQAFTKFVKPVNSLDFADKLAHKLIAAGVGCVSAEAKNQSCNAGALGAAIGEVVAEFYSPANGLEYTPDELRELLNVSKLTAGSVALLVNVDVNNAANTAYIAVENNGALKLVSSAGKAAIKLHDKYKNVDMSKITKDQFIRDVKDIGSTELIGIAADLYTLFGATSTPWARVEASLDLLVGTGINNRTDIHNDLNYIKDRYRGLQTNRVTGSIFEDKAIKALAEIKGWTIPNRKPSIDVDVPNQGLIRIIPDAIFDGTPRQLVEIKNVKYLSNTNQFRAYVNSNEPLTLIVRYDTVISKPLLRDFKEQKVQIYQTSLNAMSGGSSKLSLRSY